MEQHIQVQLRKLPAVHRVLDHSRILDWLNQSGWSRERLAEEVGNQLNLIREGIRQGKLIEITEESVYELIIQGLAKKEESQLRRVINGTGILLHTNLGRALISRSAIKRMQEVAEFYSNLEYNIDEGSRGSRHDHLEEILCRLTGAEAGMVVNNNAAAVFLILREMAQARDVIVSRGELVEIGGSFRVSEIMAESGAHLVEVGTTNKTKVSDYERGITSETALLMKVHTSNFRIYGFTETVETGELVKLGNKYEIPVYEDLGSGVLYDIRKLGIGDEPTVQEVIKQGVDLVSFSGDKLLGGPQAGLIVGKKKWIERLKKNQLARILRVDKVTLAGLEATLRLYLNPERAMKEIPVLRDLLAAPEAIYSKASLFLSILQERGLFSDWEKELIEDVSEVGGGTLPTVTIPTWVVSFFHPDLQAHLLERMLRLSDPGVITRVAKEKVLIDFRTIQVEEIETLVEVFANLNLESLKR